MRLPKSLRLARWGDFARVRKEGRSVAGKYLVLGVAEREVGTLASSATGIRAGEVGTLASSATGIRVGFVTSRKVGNAVVRNRVRRRLRAVVREFGGVLKGGVDIVTVARFRAGAASFDQLRREWRWLARKAGIWIDEPAAEGGENLSGEVTA